MFRTDKEALSIEEIKAYIERHKKECGRYIKLQKYYEGKHDILDQQKDKNVPNNKIVNPYPKYITDVLTGYFIGQPVLYSAVDNVSSEDDELLKRLLEVFKYNDEQEENADIAKTCSIKGKAFEILWMDEDSQLRFTNLQPDEVFFIYDTSLENNIRFAVRYYEVKIDTKTVEFIELYDKDKVCYYNNRSGSMNLDREESHFFGDVPLILYENNKEQMGDFEPVISLIDAYDLSQSNTLNDMEQFTDAYLVLVNMHGTDEDDIAELREDRILLVDDNGDAKWLIKDVNDAWVENYKNRIKQDIHKFSATPDMTDDNFGSNLSGVSLRYKLIAMEQLRSVKERKFKKGLQRRIELICNILKITNKEVMFTGIGMQFNNALPQNILEISQVIQNLSPYLSVETLIEQLPFVENAKEELEKRSAEQQDLIDDGYDKLKDQLPAVRDGEE
ncbi:MAG: phage portal protein [Tissierellia bacterium]|nr:phage portal protein [Tissierellia bacterium]